MSARINSREDVVLRSQSNGYVPPAESLDDEINLLDLWLVLQRRKSALVTVTAVGLAAAIAYLLFMPLKYKYTTTIEIGSQITNAWVVPIEGPDSVLAKIVETYVPLVLLEHYEAGRETQRYEIDVTLPKGSQILVLSSKGTEEQGADYKRLHTAVVSRLREDHRRVSDVLRKGLEVKIAESVRKISSLEEESRVLTGRIKRIEDERTLVAQEITRTEELLVGAERDRASEAADVTDATRALTLLMITEQLRQNRIRLSELKQRWAVELPNQRDKLEKELADIRRAVEDERADIETQRLALSGMRETRAIAPPNRLPNPVGPAKSVIVVLAVIVSLMIGVFIAFFLEFLSKIRSHAGN